MNDLIVVGCGKAKGPEPTQAQFMYTGGLFTMAREAAIRDGRPWMILSARYGLMAPDKWIEPYDQTLTSNEEVESLGWKINAQRLGQPFANASVEAWCSSRYVEALRIGNFLSIRTPMARMGIGQQRAWLKRHATEVDHED